MGSKKDESKGGPRNSVRLTGVRAGDVLVGCNERQTREVRLKVVEGEMGMSSKALEIEGRDRVVQAYTKWYGMSRVRAEQLLDEQKMDDDAKHLALGQTCTCASRLGDVTVCEHSVSLRFVISNPGQLLESAALAGEEEAEKLEAYVAEQAVVSWKEILPLMGKKTLALQRGWYQVQAFPRAIDQPESRHRIIDVAGFVGGKEEAQWLDMGEDLAIRIATVSDKSYTTDDVIDLVLSVLPSLAEACGTPETACRYAEEAVRRCAAAVMPLTIGGLKSALQKVVRFGALDVGLPDGSAVAAPVFAAVTSALLFSRTGCFVPDLQMFTRGCVGALKRLMVILLEDSWVEGAADAVAALAAAALVFQRCSELNPTPELIQAVIVMSARAVTSRAVWNWREKAAPPGCSVVNVTHSPTDSAHLETAAKLLRILRSFKGDMDMADKVAAADKRGRGRLLVCSPGRLPALMPMEHLVDQHAFRGIGHCVLPGVGSEFKQTFTRVFQRVTGINPRWSPLEGPLATFEEQPLVKKVRFGQKVILARSLGLPRVELAAIGEETLHLPLDYGVLAAAVGPVTVTVDKVKEGANGKKRRVAGKRQLIVTLGTEDVAEEMVMKKPTRNTADLYDDITEEERQAAIEQVRQMQHRLKTPYPIGRFAIFQDGEWTVDGKSWETMTAGAGEEGKEGDQAGGIEVSVPVHDAPTEMWTGDKDAAYLQMALEVTGTGLVADAEEKVREICRVTPQRTLARALSLLQQQYTRVDMPTPALNGSIGHDQLMAYACDPAVWRWLVALSRLVPGALRPEQVPKFSVPEPMLLRVLIGWLAAAACATGGEKEMSDGKRLWENFLVDDAVLMRHQRDAVDDMLHRDIRAAPGHFLVLDVGFGKTLLTSSYIRHFLNQTKLLIKAVVWVTPSDLVEATLKQLVGTWKLPACVLPADATPLKGRINLVAHDKLRKKFTAKEIQRYRIRGAASVVEVLAEWAPFMVVVYDEVDTMYANTQRTSAAHRVAAMAAKIVCQTATPLRNTRHEQLAAWLAKTESYPVDKDNWLVAANSMVSKQIDLGIKVEHEEVETEMTAEVRASHLAGGRDWAAMAKATQRATDEKMADVAAEAAVKEGGTLLVANDEAHVTRLLGLLARKSLVRAGGFEDRGNHSINVVVVSKRHCRGYNEATRLGAIVTGVYAGNGADRHQMTGRLKRIGQKRSSVRHITVFMRNSILDLLHRRHQSVDTMNLSLEALGEKYGVEVLKQLQEAS